MIKINGKKIKYDPDQLDHLSMSEGVTRIHNKDGTMEIVDMTPKMIPWWMPVGFVVCVIVVIGSFAMCM